MLYYKIDVPPSHALVLKYSLTQTLTHPPTHNILPNPSYKKGPPVARGWAHKKSILGLI